MSRAAHFHEQTMSIKEKKKKIPEKAKLTQTKPKKSTGNGVPTPSIVGKKIFCFNWQQPIEPSTMVHLIPLQLQTFIVLIPERQRTAAFKERPKSSESCVVAQKRCGLRVIKGLLRITTKRWPHRTYREQGKKKVAKQSFLFFFFFF